MKKTNPISDNQTPKRSTLDNDRLDGDQLFETPMKVQAKTDEGSETDFKLEPSPKQEIKSQGQEFRFSCPVCKSAMYAPTTAVGSKQTCPDCLMEVTIPKPTIAKSQLNSVDLNQYPDLSLKPLETAPKRSERSSSEIAEYLARAEKEIESDNEKLKAFTYDFDTSGWLLRTFAFLRDPMTILLAVATGCLFGFVIFGASLAYKTLALRSEAAGKAGAVMFLTILGAPILAGTLANGIAVLETSANNLKKVERWPMFNFSDAMDETFVVLTAFVLSGVPGGVIGWLLSMTEIDAAVSLAATLLSVWAMFPIFLLGILDNQNLTQPISNDVMRSIPARGDAWGAAYLQTGLAFVFIFIFFVASRAGSSGSHFAFGISLPFSIYFIFNQYGILASRIADIADLNLDMKQERGSVKKNK